MAEQINPYAAPAEISPGTRFSNVADGKETAWREGELLVTPVKVELPPRCVKCNGEASGPPLKLELSWHSPGWYILVFVALLIYILVAIFISRKATVYASLCEEHRRRRSRLGWTGGAVFLISLVGMIVGLSSGGRDTVAIYTLGGAIGMVVGIVVAIVGTQVLTPKKITKDFAWLKGAGPEFLSTLQSN